MGNYLVVRQVRLSASESPRRSEEPGGGDPKFPTIFNSSVRNSLVPNLTDANLKRRGTFSSCTGGKESRSRPRFSPAQSLSLRESWAICQSKCSQNATVAGVEIFGKIFTRCPELKPLFRLKLAQNIHDLPEQHQFLRHARVFTNLLNLLIKNIEELDSDIGRALITYGQRHYNKYGLLLTKSYLDLFKESILEFVTDSVTEEMANAEVGILWIELIDFTLEKLKAGNDIAAEKKGRVKEVDLKSCDKVFG